jgi:serine/threonine protein kinase
MSHRFGPYSLLECIGTGGMGEVWAAVHVELRMPCAIKLMKPDLCCDLDYERYEDMFLNEANICAQLRHGRIVRVHNSGLIDGRFFIAMDLVDGVNLRELVGALEACGDELPIPLVVHIVAEVLEALDYAHNRTIGGAEGGVIHGDVSPRNIMISSHGEVLLTDFGLGSFVSSTSPRKLVVGTPAYMAPERARGQLCRESDLYSVGAILHELLTGRTLVPRDATLAEIAALGELPILPLLRSDLPEPIEALRRGLLERHFGRRIRSTKDALTMLERWPDHHRRSSELRELYHECFGAPHSGLTLVAGRLTEPCRGSSMRHGAASLLLEDTRPLDERSSPLHESRPRSPEPATSDRDRRPWPRPRALLGKAAPRAS